MKCCTWNRRSGQTLLRENGFKKYSAWCFLLTETQMCLLKTRIRYSEKLNIAATEAYFTHLDQRPVT